METVHEAHCPYCGSGQIHRQPYGAYRCSGCERDLTSSELRWKSIKRPNGNSARSNTQTVQSRPEEV